MTMTAARSPDLITYDEAAQLTGKSKRTLRRYVEADMLSVYIGVEGRSVKRLLSRAQVLDVFSVPTAIAS